VSKRNDGKGYRAPQPTNEQPRRGLFGSFLQPRAPIQTAMPRGWASYTRGLGTALASPTLLVLVPVVVIVEWLVVLALGAQGPATLLAGTFQWPGPGTFVDSIVSQTVLPSARSALIGIFVLVIVRSALLAIVTTISVERLRTGTSSAWAWRRALVVWPVTLTVNMLGVAVFLITSIGGQFLEALGLGFLVFVGGLAATVYLTAYAPAIAADEDHRMPAAMQRGIRTSRMPGTGTLMVAVVYTVAMFAVDVAFLPSAGLDTVPSVAQWVGVVAIGYLNLGAIAMFAYRYLSVANEVPEPQAPTQRRR
jgi:hypothetical protein